MDTALYLMTFDDAFHQRRHPEGLLFHTDQGSQYTACESFFHTLKKEALYHYLYETPQELEEVLDEYIDFYNGYRPHGKLNMKTPIQYEAEFFSATRG